MASLSTNSTKKADDEHQKSDCSSKTSHESKKGSPTGSSNIVEIEEEHVVVLKRMKCTDQTSDLSPHPIHKQSYIPLACAPIRTQVPCCQSTTSRSGASHLASAARPFEDILVGQPNSDVPLGTFPKPGDTNSSFTKRP